MNTVSRWVSITLQPEKIHGHSITVKDKTGREIKGHLDVARVNNKGQSVVRASYNLNPKSKRTAFAAFYLTQEQMDIVEEGGERWILNAPANPSRWGYK
jgi:UDP-N-acetylmuramyl pentapeptide synthase